MTVSTIAVVLALVCLTQASLGPVVVTPSGAVSGWERLSRDGHLYESFTGIPYAEPPIGKLRFQPPIPAQKWTGIINATGDMIPCAQYSTTHHYWSENCLYLSVYRPKHRTLERLPVIVRIHGGAFQRGSVGAREAADYLMDEQVVLVTLHYRLNIFGFISLGDAVVPGNYGMKDQVLALRWVKQNIAAFGGDPSSITLIGESAGASSTHILLKSPAAQDLVTRAVSDSGAINPIWSLKMADKVKAQTMKVAAEVDCLKSTSKEILECLQQVEATQLLNVIAESIQTMDPAFVPVIEPKSTEDAVATEDLSLVPTKKPWITSVCNGEFLLFLHAIPRQAISDAASDLSGFLENWVKDHINYQGDVKESAQILESVYFTTLRDLKGISLQLAKMVADASFIFPVIHDLNNHQGPKWMYRFEYVGELSFFNQSVYPEAVAGHAETMVYYFNQRSEYNKKLSPNQTMEDYRISKTLINHLVNFAYYDDPTPPGSPFTWSPMKTNEILRIANDGITQEGQWFYRQFDNVFNLWNFVIGWSS